MNINSKLMDAMAEFRSTYDAMRSIIREYERETGKSINDLPRFVELYPFNRSLDELHVSQWVDCTIEGLKQPSFKELDYKYVSAGSGCMVGIFEMWLPEDKRVVYVLTNEEGCDMSIVDYISHDPVKDLGVSCFSDIIIDQVDWGNLTGYEKYFELYKHCLNKFLKSDCKHFNRTRGIPLYLISDELKKTINAKYLAWLEAIDDCVVTTDGEQIIECPYYEPDTVDEAQLAITRFKSWHERTAGAEELYDRDYAISIAGKSVRLPYNADIWSAIDKLLQTVIDEW